MGQLIPDTKYDIPEGAIDNGYEQYCQVFTVSRAHSRHGFRKRPYDDQNVKTVEHVTKCKKVGKSCNIELPRLTPKRPNIN